MRRVSMATRDELVAAVMERYSKGVAARRGPKEAVRKAPACSAAIWMGRQRQSGLESGVAALA